MWQKKIVRCLSHLILSIIIRKLSIKSNCEITFNESYQGDNTAFFKNVYGTYNFENNKFYKSFDNPKITLPPSSTVNDVYYEEGVTV